MKKAIRHWDIAIVQCDSLPSWLKKHISNIFLEWKNNDHSIDQWEIYITHNPNSLSENRFLYGYIVAKDTTLIHNEHWIWETNKKAKIPDGIWEIYKQKEYKSNGFRIIQD